MRKTKQQTFTPKHLSFQSSPTGELEVAHGGAGGGFSPRCREIASRACPVYPVGIFQSTGMKFEEYLTGPLLEQKKIFIRYSKPVASPQHPGYTMTQSHVCLIPKRKNSLPLKLKICQQYYGQGEYRFSFYINDHHPPHIHVEKERSTAKFLIKNAELVKSKRFNASELNEIRKIILENIELFKIKWDERFTNY